MTKDEISILLIKKGKKQVDIAKDTGLDRSTVNNHLSGRYHSPSVAKWLSENLEIAS